MKTYKVVGEGWLNGAYVLDNQQVSMTDEQAKYYLMDGRIVEVKTQEKAKSPKEA